MTRTASALYFTGPRTLRIDQEPVRDPGPGEVAIEALASGISAGTELNVFRAHAGGATHVLDPHTDGVAEAVRDLTGGRGADVVIEVSGAAPALNEAIRTAGYKGTVVAMSWYRGTFETLSLSGEFHHNRARIVSSQVGAVNPDLGPLWSVSRRAAIARGYLATFAADLSGFITHRLPLAEAQRGYNLIDEGDPGVMQVVIDYRLDG